MTMRLTGDRNQCQGCKRHFNSTAAFDKHRTGDFGGGRRCLTDDEMLAKGMDKNSAGFWVGSRMGNAALPWTPRSRDQGLVDRQVATSQESA
jgi:hypothetical protein